MTRPAQPQPYPGDVRRPAAADRMRRRPFTKAFRDSLNRPLNGTLTLLDPDGGAVATVEVVDGQLSADIASGTYRMVGALQSLDGTWVHLAEPLTVGAYR